MSQLYDANGNPAFTDVLAQNQPIIAAAGQVLAQLRGQATAVVQITGTFVATLQFEGTVDGVNFFAVNMYPVAGGAATTSTTAVGQWIGVVAGFYQFRVRCSAYTSGTATTSVNVAQGTNEQAVAVGSSQGIASAGILGVLVQGAVTTAAPTYTTANMNPLSLTTAGALRTDWSSQGATAITSVPVAAGTGTLTGNAPVVNAAIFVGTAAGVAAAAGVLKVGITGNAGAIFDSATAATVPANALYSGARAQNVNPTSVTNGQMVGLAADLSGKLIITPLAYRTLISHASATVAVNTISTLLAAGAAGVFRDITRIVVTTLGAAANTLTITDGTVSFVLDYPNAAIAPSAPFILNFDGAPLRATTAATVWQVTQSLATQCRYLVQYVERIA
jgi:hypothetical protein